MPPTPSGANERLTLLRDLSERAWQQTGKPLPTGSRQAISVVLRPLV